MLDLLQCGRNKLDDPILMSWALRRYEHAKLQGSEHCRPMEEAWFHDLTLRRWIDAGDHAVLTELFYALPSRRFSNLKAAIVERWRAWSGRLGAGATTVLMECPFEVVLPLLARHIEEDFSDVEKTLAVIASITDLPTSNALELLDDITDRVSELQNESFTRQMLLQALLRPTAALNLGALVPLTETCSRAAPLDKDEMKRLLKAVCSALFGNAGLMENAKYLMGSNHAQPLRSLQPLFTSDAPLEECDRILIGSNPGQGARNLLQKYRAAAATTEIAFSVIDIVQSMHGPENEDMACFAIAAVLRAFEREEIETSRFSMEEALNVLTLDLSDNRHLLQLTRRLSAFASQDVARAVSERMPTVRDGWGGIHLTNMAGELRLVDTIPMLINSLGRERGDFLCEAAQKSLVQIGEPAQLALIAQWDALDRSQKIYGRTALEQIGGEYTCKFAIDRFHELFGDDDESWCALAEAAPDERLIDLLEPEIRRKQSRIDKCFYLLCALTERKHDNLKDIRERVVDHRQRALKRRLDLAAGNFRGVHDTVVLTLKCERCGDANRYEVKSIVVGNNRTGPACFVGDELPCASCGDWPDFEFTTEAHMQVMAAMITLAAATGSANDKHKGPLRLVDVKYRWEERPAPEVMAELKSAATQHPQNIVNQLRLGRFQYAFGRLRRASECYNRALEIEPDSMEAGLGIAHVMADTGKQRGAFDRLSAMLERKSKWRFFRVDELPPKGLAEDFALAFNKLQSALGVRGRPLLRTSFAQSYTKVGRNDPCPCGSGRKYKKCCADKQTAMVH